METGLDLRLRKSLTVSEARAITGIGKNNFYRMLQNGEIRSLRVGKKWVIPVAEVDRWLAQAGQQETKCSAARPRQAR